MGRPPVSRLQSWRHSQVHEAPQDTHSRPCEQGSTSQKETLVQQWEGSVLTHLLEGASLLVLLLLAPGDGCIAPLRLRNRSAQKQWD